MVKISKPTNVKVGDKILIDCIPARKKLKIEILDIGLSILDSFSYDLFSFRFKYKNFYYWHDSNCIINDFYRKVEHIELESFDNPVGFFFGDVVYERCIKYNDKFYRIFKGTYIKDSEGNKYFITYQ